VLGLAVVPESAHAAIKAPSDTGAPNEECMNRCQLAFDFCSFFSWDVEALFAICLANYYICLKGCGWVPTLVMAEFRCTPVADPLRHILEPDAIGRPRLLTG
jgi:hypothetical protein